MSQELSDREWRQMRRQMNSLAFDPVPETPVPSSEELDTINDDVRSSAALPEHPLTPLSANDNTCMSRLHTPNLDSIIAAAQTTIRQSILDAVADVTTRVEREADLVRLQSQAAHLNQMAMLEGQIQVLQARLHLYETTSQHNEVILEGLSQYFARFKQHTRRMWSNPHSIVACFHGWKRWCLDKKHKRTQRHMTNHLMQKQSQQILLQQWKLLTQQTNAKKQFDKLQHEHQQEMELAIKDHEVKLQQMQQEVENARKEQSIAQQGRQQLEDDLRKVFLRGVSAMNMEAMTLFESAYKESGVEDGQVLNRVQATGGQLSPVKTSNAQSVQKDEQQPNSNESISPPIPQTPDMSTKLLTLLATSTAKLPPSSTRRNSSQTQIPTALLHGLRSAELVEVHQRMQYASSSDKLASSTSPSTTTPQRKSQSSIKYQVDMEYFRNSVTAASGCPASLSPSLSTPMRSGSSKWR